MIDPFKKIVTNFQLRTALRMMEKFEDAQALVAATEDQVIKDAWEYANVFNHDDPRMTVVCDALGVDKDELFTLAFDLG